MYTFFLSAADEFDHCIRHDSRVRERLHAQHTGLDLQSYFPNYREKHMFILRLEKSSWIQP